MNTDQKVVVSGGGGFIDGRRVGEPQARGDVNAWFVENRPSVRRGQRLGRAERLQAGLGKLQPSRKALNPAAAARHRTADKGGADCVEGTNRLRMLSAPIRTPQFMGFKERLDHRLGCIAYACVCDGGMKRAIRLIGDETAARCESL